jgi:hypothetical protein
MNNTEAPISPALSYDANPSTDWIEIRRDGAYVTTVTSYSALLAWFHQNCPMSMHWALTNEGYSIHECPERIVFFHRDAEGVEHTKVKTSRLAAKRALTAFYRTDEYQGAKDYGWRVERAHNGQWVQL